MGRWSRRARSLGQAFVDVLQAEIADLVEELQRTGKGWLKAVLFFAGAAAFAFWAVGVFTAFLVVLLAVWMEPWQAAGVVLLFLTLLAGGLAFAGWRIFQKQRPPTEIVRGHVDDHLDWWRESLAPARKVGSGRSARDGGRDEDEADAPDDEEDS